MRLLAKLTHITPSFIPSFLGLLMTMILGMGASVAWAQDTSQAPSYSTRIKQLGNYQIFPTERYGNALYLNRQLLASFGGRMILDLQEIPNGESLVYLYRDEEQNLALGLYDFSESKRARIKRVDDEFYEVWVFSLGIRAIFRIFDGKIERVASHLRTARGVTPSVEQVAFYHISASEVLEGENGKYRVYDFRIHVLKRKQTKPLRLSVTVRDSRSILNLSWPEATVLRYELMDGTIKDLSLSELLPDHF